MPHNIPTLSVVVPVYNSADCVEALLRAITEALSEKFSFEIILVNDCSPDTSWAIIQNLLPQYKNLTAINLRRNYGQETALLTGLRHMKGRYAVLMDDDLQHNPHDIPRLLQHLEDTESDLVFGIHPRGKEPWWRLLGSYAYNKLMEWVIAKPEGLYLSAYKVMRREVVDLITPYQGHSPSIEGLVFKVTQRISTLQVEHRPRYAGVSNYSFWKSVKLCWKLALFFSCVPLRLATASGLVVAGFSFLAAVGIIIRRLATPEAFNGEAMGWASLMTAILFIGGLLMIFLGIIGEYVGQTYFTVNRSTPVAVADVVTHDSK